MGREAQMGGTFDFPFPVQGIWVAGPTSFLKLLSHLVKETGLLLFLPPLRPGFLRLPCGASSSTVPSCPFGSYSWALND